MVLPSPKANPIRNVVRLDPNPYLPIVGSSDHFPIRRIYCVGRNYADHAVEMGHDPNKEAPFFFQKNPDNIFRGSTLKYPSGTTDLHHEVELVVAIERGGSRIPVHRALEAVYGYAVGLDMTKRDLQAEAKKMGRPWTMAKAFEHSAPCSPIVPASKIGHPTSGAITLSVNADLRQSGNLDQMIWKVPEIISYLSHQITLAPGDLIMTGTPAGVGPVRVGEQLHCKIENIGTLDLKIDRPDEPNFDSL